jgi:hypothetical protein
MSTEKPAPKPEALPPAQTLSERREQLRQQRAAWFLLQSDEPLDLSPRDPDSTPPWLGPTALLD